MRLLFTFLWMMACLPQLFAQTLLRGTVKDSYGEALAGANVYLEHTYDGTSADSVGYYSFTTDVVGEQVLIISAIAYETQRLSIRLQGDSQTVEVTLEESIGAMEGVTITAGAFEAGDSRKSVVLNSMDIVTTAGALGDISGALQTLPGTQTVGEDGRLFVRGGEGYETQVFIDGMLAQTPFNAQVPNLPTRGRFSPFLFKGTTFSTGGYSAEFGQALSSALILDTKDQPEQTQTDISLMTVGGDVTHQQAWDDASMAVKAGYTNLAPYQWLVPQDVDMYQAPESSEASIVGRKKTSETGFLKAYVHLSRSRLGLKRQNLNEANQSDSIQLQNDNLYANLSYRELLGKRWSLQTGVSFTYDQQISSLNHQQLQTDALYLHAKAVLIHDLSEKVALRMGSETMREVHTQLYASKHPASQQQLTQQVGAAFVEGDIHLSQRWVIRPGLRLSYTSLNHAYLLAPRYSMAYKTSKSSQVSLAFGQYFQQQSPQWLLQNDQLSSARADHYLLNYQHIRQGKTFRAEAYYKKYHSLVKLEHGLQEQTARISSQGSGYARGLDIFWRDRNTIPQGDYWISYSLLDTKREYLYYPRAAMPDFASRHNFSAVYKHFVSSVRTQLGGSYQWSSGRPYENPNRESFMTDRTPSYHSLSLNAAFLFKEHIILYGSVSNVLGTRNIFGYEYASQPNAEGIYQRQAVEAPAPRFFFLGLFITLSKDQQANQLDQL